MRLLTCLICLNIGFTSSISSIRKSNQKFICSRGHGVPPKFCSLIPAKIQVNKLDHGIKIIFDDVSDDSPAGENQVLVNTESYHRLDDLTKLMMKRWNVSFQSPPSVSDNSCQGYTGSSDEVDLNAMAFLFDVSFDEAIGGKINYYQFHVDVLLPLYAAFEEMGVVSKSSPSLSGDSSIILIPRAISPITGEDLTHQAFSQKQHLQSFWFQSLLVMITTFHQNHDTRNWLISDQSEWENSNILEFGVTQDNPTEISSSIKNEEREEYTDTAHLSSSTHQASIHFKQGVFLGLPSLEVPSSALMKRFVKFMRNSLSLSETPVPCEAPDVIGFVKRTNRRIITNEKELLQEIEKKTGAKVRYIEFGNAQEVVPSASEFANNNTNDTLDVDSISSEKEREAFGKISNASITMSPYMKDVLQVQDLRVLVGGQGSGLINGIYLPPLSSNVILYQYKGWDVFEHYLKPRGALFSWYNVNESRSFCDKVIDPFCDSPDTEVDIEAVVDMVRGALLVSKSHCV